MRDRRFPYWALATAIAVSSCQRTPDADAPGDAIENQSSLPHLPVAEPPLDRAGLLGAVAQAASVAALGEKDTEKQRLLDGKRFEMRIRFGCPLLNRTAGSERFLVTFDEEKRTLRIRAAQDLTLEDPPIAQLAPDSVEAVEGFWLHRPWILEARCPAVARTSPREVEPVDPNANLVASAREAAQDTAAAPAPSDAEAVLRVGIAQFFTKADSRTGRRDQRAYETTKVLAEGERPSPDGYNFVLSGRLRALPEGRVINCRAPSFDRPPDCVVSAEFDRVWIEHPNSEAVVAEWSR